MKVYITYNGCQMRGLDASRMKLYFIKNDCSITTDVSEADYVVFYTCSVNEITLNHSLQIIEKLNANPKAKIIITGCLPSIAPQHIDNISNELIIPLRKIEHIDAVFPDFKYKYSGIQSVGTIEIERRDSEGIDLTKGVFTPFTSKNKISTFFDYFKKQTTKDIKTYYLKISDGCNNQCEYCNIKKAIGSLKSRPIDEIIIDYNNAIANGYNNIVFIADDPGAYGMDISFTFKDLIDNLIKLDDTKNINWVFDEINPQWVIKYYNTFYELVKNKKTDTIVCPIQSGSQRILNLMNRPYLIDNVLSFLKTLKSINKQIDLQTHIIVGFPGETESDFKETLKLFDEDYWGVKLFSHSLVSAYYENDYTKSRSSLLKVDSDVIEERIHKLKVLFDIKKISYFIS